MTDECEVHGVKGVPGLFFGPVQALTQLQKLGITHVLSVVNYEPPVTKGICTLLHSDVEDSTDVNLLAHLPAAVDFIHQALSTLGRVLVHCDAGRSRSVAVAMAYLMSVRSIDAETALAHVRERCPEAEPNEGFMSQLELWHYMKYRLDESCGPYKYFLLQQMGQRWEQEGYIDPTAFGQVADDNHGQATMYRCRKCRKLLASSEHIIPSDWVHASSRRSFGHQRYVSSAPDPGDADASLFIQPMVWMREAITGNLQGKLYCPGCNTRLGSFNWSGIRHTTGDWVTPAFQLHASKVDAIEPRPLAALAGIRHPLVGPAAAARPAAPPGPPRTAPPQHIPADPEEPAQSHQYATTGAQAVEVPVAAGSTATSADPTVAAVSLATSADPTVVAAGSPATSADPPAADAPASPATSAGPTATAAGSLTTSADPPAADAPASSASPGDGAGGADGTAPALAGPASACAHDDNGHEARVAAVAGRQGDGGGPRRFDFLVLDCDGVLVDSERASCEALRLAILEVTGFDIPHGFPDDYREVFGMDVRSCVQHYRDRFERSDWGEVDEVAPNVTRAKEVIYKRLTSDGVVAFAGAAELIQAATARGLGVGVGSSGAPEKIRHNLETSGLSPLLDWQYVVSAAQVGRGKPAPDVYLEVLRRLGCTDPSRALIVEDAVNGLAAGRAAGAFLVAVASSLPAEDLRPHADLVLTHLADLDLDNLLCS